LQHYRINYAKIESMEFQLTSDYQPTGDQPEAIQQLTEGILNQDKYQILLGVTGSGKTFTIANVIQQVQRPTLVLSHNKTLAAQLYGEFKQFFPKNAVEYFVSYYDYYQPEAYIPVTDTYIEKDLSINDEIEKLRLSTTSSLLSGRRDVIVVSSVSCLYGIGNPEDFYSNTLHIETGQVISRNQFLRNLVDSMYSRAEIDFKMGTFRVRGDSVDIYLAYNDLGYRIIFWGDEIEAIESFDPVNGNTIDKLDAVMIYPANIFVTTKYRLKSAIEQIEQDLIKQIDFFRDLGKEVEAKRIEERVNYDIEMIKELGHCPGIENYSRYFDGRAPGTRPFCLLDYFPDDFLMIVDESHASIPQIRAMYGGDHSRKQTLVEYGFRLPAAIDNRPLKFEEYEDMINQVIFVSATPADYELAKCDGIITEQVIRPTGLLDPVIEVRPSLNQIDHLLGEIHERTGRDERMLVTTLTKRMAEELTKYLLKLNIRCRYIHSDIDTLERVEIIEGLRKGTYADKEGFLRSEKSLTQTAGRAARNLNGKVIMYADTVTHSMQKTIDETNRRREKQLKYNAENNITPQQIVKASKNIMGLPVDQISRPTYYAEPEEVNIAADPLIQYMDASAIRKTIDKTRRAMEQAAKKLDFIEAARLRDELYALQEILNKK